MDWFVVSFGWFFYVFKYGYFFYIFIFSLFYGRFEIFYWENFSWLIGAFYEKYRWLMVSQIFFFFYFRWLNFYMIDSITNLRKNFIQLNLKHYSSIFIFGNDSQTLAYINNPFSFLEDNLQSIHFLIWKALSKIKSFTLLFSELYLLSEHWLRSFSGNPCLGFALLDFSCYYLLRSTGKSLLMQFKFLHDNLCVSQIRTRK